MKLKLLATFFLISSYLSSQQTVTTSGGDIESDQVSLSYTIGQLLIKNYHLNSKLGSGKYSSTLGRRSVEIYPQSEYPSFMAFWVITCKCR